jgi:hypothetical protein
MNHILKHVIRFHLVLFPSLRRFASTSNFYFSLSSRCLKAESFVLALPNEIIFNRLEYLSLTHAFYNINQRFNKLLRLQFRKFHLDFRLIFT